MARTLQQKLATLEGLQKEIEKQLKDLEDDDLHLVMYRMKEELYRLLLEIDELNRLADSLAHAVAVSTEERTIPLWADQAYRSWERRLKKRWFPE